MILSETDRHFYISQSTIPWAGKGLFTRVSIAKGSKLEVVGVLVRANSVSDRSTRYMDIYKFRVGRFLLIPMGFGGMVNHSMAPNMKKVIHGNQVYLRALRRIKKEEELLFTYSKYAQKRFEL